MLVHGDVLSRVLESTRYEYRPYPQETDEDEAGALRLPVIAMQHTAEFF